MVLSGLALSILGLFRYMRQATSSVPSSRAHQQHSAASLSSDMEVISLREDDRAQRELHAALLHNPGVADRGLGVRERELEIQDRETHFMSSARGQALVPPMPPLVLRSISSKRKLDDYEIGMAESSVSATSQVCKT